MIDSGWMYFCLLIVTISLTGPVFTHGNVPKSDNKLTGLIEKFCISVRNYERKLCLYKWVRDSTNWKGSNQILALKLKPIDETKLQIPSRFSLQLQRDSSDFGLNNTGRKLLNTEKLIFKTDGIDSVGDQEFHVLVTVEPEGVVALPGMQESTYVIFNIVCDKLLLGIPQKAWYVVFLVLLCLGLAVIVPKFLPPFLLPKNGSPSLTDRMATKDS